MTIRNDYPLKAHNTFGLSACCRQFIEYTSDNEAIEAAQMLRDADQPFLIIGEGSNLLLTKDFPGIVVRSAIKGRTIKAQADGTLLLECGSGEQWEETVRWTVSQGYSAFVNLSLIPGDVGASAIQNIGAYGVEVAQYIDHIRAVDIATGQMVVIDAAECYYAYRDSRFKHEWKNRFLICQVCYRLPQDETLRIGYGNISEELARRQITSPTAEQLRQVIIDIRRQKLPDPSVLGNAGSFFMNPIISRKHFERLVSNYPDMPHYEVDTERVKIPAAWLIDQCGWKGRSMGRAGVHQRQPLVLVNLGGATGDEVVALCRAIQDDVKRKFGIELHPEVNIV